MLAVSGMRGCEERRLVVEDRSVAWRLLLRGEACRGRWGLRCVRVIACRVKCEWVGVRPHAVGHDHCCDVGSGEVANLRADEFAEVRVRGAVGECPEETMQFSSNDCEVDWFTDNEGLRCRRCPRQLIVVVLGRLR